MIALRILITLNGYGQNVPKGYGEDESVAGDKKSHGINIGMNNL